MFSNLPFELIEIIAGFMDIPTLVNMSEVDERVKEILYKGGRWIVTFPPRIDWSSPTAPKKYIEYDRTDFTIHLKDKVFRRSDGIVFTTELDKNRDIKRFVSPRVTLDFDKMVIETRRTTGKCLVLGMSEYELDLNLVCSSLQKWPRTVKVEKKIPPIQRKYNQEDELIEREFRMLFPPRRRGDENYRHEY